MNLHQPPQPSPEIVIPKQEVTKEIHVKFATVACGRLEVIIYHTLEHDVFVTFIHEFNDEVKSSEHAKPSDYKNKIIKFINKKMSPIRVAFKSKEAYMAYISAYSTKDVHQTVNK